MNETAGLPRIIVSAGEPAGIGPELVLALARAKLSIKLSCVADPSMLHGLSTRLGLDIDIIEIDSTADIPPHRAGTLHVIPRQLRVPVTAGQLQPDNAAYVLECLDTAISACVDRNADAMVTAPLQKSVINDAGITFTGHTEYLAEKTAPGVQPVMLLAAGDLRVALATTHLPLARVVDSLSEANIRHAIEVIDHSLRKQFSIDKPKIAVCGVNPHAGESGHFGREEIEIIQPAIAFARSIGIDVVGPLPGDTAFTPSNRAIYDCYLSMFHDQGLPVIKALSFGEIVNVTLGLPIIRTSVDHGTGLDIAGRGTADAASLIAAVKLAARLAQASKP